jgi:prepilin-type N-terminal cleavage/methylation domain-containing protein
MITNTSKQKGFSLIEIIISIGLIVIISTLTYFSSNALNNRQSFDKQLDFIKSSISQTRVNALNSKNGTDQSITFGTTSMIYNNQEFILENDIQLQSYTTSTSTIIFYRLTGFPNATGALIYNMKKGDKVVASSSIIINNLGIIDN